MSIATTDRTAGSLLAPAPVAQGDRAWLVGRWFDLFFVANLFWPLAILFCFDLTTWLPKNSLTFFQLYFLSSPHRWITLALVFCDRERFWKQPVRFGGLGLALVAGGSGLVWLAGSLPAISDSLLLLMMVDYAWNAWHFAAQHAGISRIYSRVLRVEATDRQIAFEKMAIRLLVLWAFFRLAVYVGAVKLSEQLGVRMEVLASLDAWLGWLDPVMVAPIGILLIRELRAYSPQRLGRICYIASVATLYAAQLVALHLLIEPLMSGLFLASAIFHATEYLAVVHWAEAKKVQSSGWLRIARVAIGIPVFMVLIGIMNYGLNSRAAWSWAFVTLVVSLLHYAYDGMIWKARPAAKPA